MFPDPTTASATGLRLAYGSNGLSDHRLGDACALLAANGYDGIALTLDHQHLDPCALDLAERAVAVRRLLDRHGLDVVVETGGRYVLDPRRKHHPTLCSAERSGERVAMYLRALDVCTILGSPVLHLWSGTAPDGEAPEVTWERLAAGLAEVVEAARAVGVVVGLEPEPGHVVDTIAAFERLAADLGDPAALGITLDVGHCRCLEPEDEASCIRRVADRLVHVQIEDMRRGVHEHLPFGEGEVDLRGAVAALAEVRYPGLVSVELPRHGHAAAALVPASAEALRRACADAAVPVGAAPDAGGGR